jgi:predicted transcriptional regulator of viral defense system
MDQMAMIGPTRHVSGARLTDRQRAILRLPDAYGIRIITPSLVRTVLGYADAQHAIERMVARGWLRRVGHGQYRVRRVGERVLRPR